MTSQNQNSCNYVTENEVIDKENDDIEFSASELGTKVYWDESYKNALKCFEQNGDIGDVWFGEESMLRVIKWITSSKVSHSSSIIDIGCGNGIFLSYLTDEGFNDLYGIDYSEDAIRLAKSVALKRDTPIKFEVLNIAKKNLKNGILSKKHFDVVHDKGTFDAISLCPDDAKTLMQIYVENVAEILVEGGYYIITSCNWTENELIPKFNLYFEKETTLPTPIFQFGGKIGTAVTSLVMRKTILHK